ncbi:MAG: LLM class flavin-dependent oxidoreductase [Actinobacteria bacterium]|nr:LLM class flavin-dependent oxidoreductase [Actinomycetota bacterium]
MATLTIGLPTFGTEPEGGWRRVVDLAAQVEATGADRIVITDHVVMGRNTNEYAWGKFPVPPDAPWLEPVTMLASIAMATERVRLATGILIAPLRPAALLAKSVATLDVLSGGRATLDVLSGGRVDLGVGTGWQREEFDAQGLDFDQRGQLLTDVIGACRALWDQTPATFSSPTVTFAEIFCEPKPAQARLPVWFSGVLHRRNRDRITRLGDGWIPIMGSNVEDIRDGVHVLHADLAASGRDPAELRVQGSPAVVRGDDKRIDIEQTMPNVRALVAAGATDININIRAISPVLDDAVARVPALVDALAN